MRQTRKRQRHAKSRLLLVAVRSAVVWIVPVGLMVSGISYMSSGSTYALLANQRLTSSSSFAALSTETSLKVDTPRVELGRLQTGESVSPKKTQFMVTNISPRTITLKADLIGITGLDVTVTPTTLEPGEAATVHITGRVKAPGNASGYVELSAFGGFLSLKVPVQGIFEAPPPVKGTTPAVQLPAPPPSETAPPPAELPPPPSTETALPPAELSPPPPTETAPQPTAEPAEAPSQEAAPEEAAPSLDTPQS